MPFIKISGLEKEKLCSYSEDIIDIVEKGVEVPRERIKLFYNPMVEIRHNQEVEDKTVNIEIDWLPRTQELCDKVSQMYKEFFEKLGYKKIRIYINEIRKERNYDYK